jgi:hypothetical protein
VLERSRFLLRENDHLPGSFCESLEHGTPLQKTVAAWSRTVVGMEKHPAPPHHRPRRRPG